MNKMLAGLIGGFAATAPMTAAMILMHRMLPPAERYPLPPRRVTMNVARKAGVKHKLSEPQRQAATLVSHFGYGAAMGGLFATFADRVPAPRPAAGVGWGLIVWAGSYLGFLPTLGLHERATRHPRGRNVLMILAHVVWGAALGTLIDPLRTGQPLASRNPRRRATNPTRHPLAVSHR